MNTKPNIEVKWWRLIGVLIIAGYFVSVAQTPFEFSLIGSFNLIMHEAGHWIFGIFGHVIGMLGGSLMQLLVPLVFLLAFWIKRQPLGAVFCIFWLGKSLLEVAFYAGDAIVMQLPLLGGDAVYHDWNWLLSHFGWLQYTEQIAGTMTFIGWAIIVFGLIYGIHQSVTLIKEHIQA